MDIVGIAKVARSSEFPVSNMMTKANKFSPFQRNLKPDAKASRQQLIERVKANMRPTSG
jgi:hypothetical protein